MNKKRRLQMRIQEDRIERKIGSITLIAAPRDNYQPMTSAGYPPLGKWDFYIRSNFQAITPKEASRGFPTKYIFKLLRELDYEYFDTLVEAGQWLKKVESDPTIGLYPFLYYS